MPEPEGSRKRNSEAVVLPPKLRMQVADAPMLSVVVAPNAFTVVAVVLSRAKVVDAVVSDVVILGLVPNTSTPVPVSSVMAAARLADDGVPSQVATLAPNDVMPVPPLATGSAVPERVTAKVPVVVTGLPVTLRKDGTDIATLVTDPLPPDGVAHVPLPHQKVVPLAPVPEFKLPTGRLPLTSAARFTVLHVGAPAALPCRT